jgi:hypothetical protein
MPTTPKFSYFISRLENPVFEGHPTWNKPLPLTRSYFAAMPAKSGDGIMTIGDYFLAARLFFEKSGLDMIAGAFRQRFKNNIKPGHIEQISIMLVKHGEFYHPSRVEVRVQKKQMVFVLNVAISRTGKAHVKAEYQTLRKLNQEFPFAVLPQVYGCDEVYLRDNHPVVMFFGQWFENYYEFHISRDPADKKNKLVVWDSKRGNDFLSADQSLDLYMQAAGILTGYYNLESFEQINSWHHAAGDFIVYRDNKKIDLKLITVRRYASRFKHLDNRNNIQIDVELIMQALLVFFLNLSLKMRLDRLDGVGDIVWADNRAVQGTLIGFLNALGLKPQVPSLPDSALRCFFYYLSVCSKTDLLDITETILSTFNPDSPEVDVIARHLNSHIDTLHHCIHQL